MTRNGSVPTAAAFVVAIADAIMMTPTTPSIPVNTKSMMSMWLHLCTRIYIYYIVWYEIKILNFSNWRLKAL